MQKKNELKKKNQASSSEPFKSRLLFQTRDLLNWRPELIQETQHPPN
jgi:hypothetical protein